MKDDSGRMKPASGAPDRNPFGGGNPHGLYVPMSEDEQEVVARLVESKDLELVIHGWATLPQPRIIFGDLRVTVLFNLAFSGPMTSLRYLDLELKTHAGLPLFRQRMLTENAGLPVMVGQGVDVDFAWDIAIDHMDPTVVKMIKPGSHGLTSRRLDKDTGERTRKGNMALSEKQRTMLKVIEDGAARIRAEDAKNVAKAAGPLGIPEVPDKKILVVVPDKDSGR